MLPGMPHSPTQAGVRVQAHTETHTIEIRSCLKLKTVLALSQGNKMIPSSQKAVFYVSKSKKKVFLGEWEAQINSYMKNQKQ